MAKILIVDDRPVNREFLTTLLGYSGHRLLEAPNSAEALELLRAERPDLVITDILMPTMDGYEFAHQVRAQADQAIAKTPIIFYSSTYNAREARALARAAGVSYVIAKPAMPQLILDTVNAALGLAPVPVKPETKTLQDPIQIMSSKLTEKMGELDTLGRRLATLVELMLRVSSEREGERLLDVACDAARAVVGAQYAAIGMLNDDRQTLRHFATSGMDPETVARIGPLPTGKGVLGKLLAEGKPLRLRDIAADPASVGFPPGHPPMRSFLGVPIATPAGLYGRLYLTEKAGAAEFSEEDERVAIALAAQVAVAYENVIRYDEIQGHAVRLQLEITARKKVEAELADSEERFRSWVENAMDLITVVDMQGAIRYASPSAERLLGYAPAELVGRSAYELIHPKDRLRLVDLFQQNTPEAGNQVITEFRLRDREGAWREFEATGKTIVDRQGSTVGLIYSRDISERKRAEEARERLVSIIEAATDMIAWSTPDGRVVYINRAGRQMLGVGEYEDISNTSIAEYVPAWANTIIFNEGIRTAIAKGSWTGECALLARDGGETLVSQSILAHYGPDGGVLYLSTIMRDISERKQAEAALRNYARQQAAVAEIGQRALTQEDLWAFMGEAARLAAETLEAKFCEVMELAPDGESLRLRAGVGWREGTVGQASVSSGARSQAGYTLLSEGAVVADDLSGELRFSLPGLLSDHGVASGMSVAIRLRAGVFGVLGVFTAQARQFSADDVHFLEAVASVLGQAVERKAAEAALATSEAELRGLFAAMTDVVLVLDAEGRYLQIAPTDPTILVKPPAELLGRTIHEVLPKADADKLLEEIQRALRQQQKVQVQYSLVINKVLLWFDGTVSPIGPDQVIWISRDVTERRQRQLEVEFIATVSIALRTAVTRAQMSAIILDQLINLFRANGSTLDMFDPASGDVVIESARGTWADLAGQRLPPGQGNIGQIIASGKKYVNDDARSDPRMLTWAVTEDLRAVACVPVFAQGQAIGGLWVGRETPFGDDDIRVLTAISDIAGNAMHRATLHEQTERRLEHLGALRSIDMAISSSLDVVITLNVVLDQVVTQLGVDAADVLLLSASSQGLEYTAGRGFRSPALRRTSQRLGQGYAGRAALERRQISLPDLAAGDLDRTRAGFWAGEDFRAYYGVPLITKGAVAGVLEIYHRAPLQPDTEWLDFLDALAGQAAIAIDNTRLFHDLQRSNVDLKLAYEATIEGWSRALDLRDKETEGHTQRVTEQTLQLARSFGVSEDELAHIRHGALLHDIGKMGVPDSILLKPGPLTDDEWVIMRQHPDLAFQMLAPIAFLGPALNIPYCHHENWDGTGYPRGLKGESIPLAARIFAVEDVWDALRSDRPYRKGWPAEQVREHILAGSGTHFDPAVVEAFLRLTSN